MNSINKFYQKVLKPTLTSNTKLQIKLKNIKNQEQYLKFLQDEILPLAKAHGYDIDLNKILTYESERAQSLSEKDLEKVSGGRGIGTTLTISALLSFAGATLPTMTATAMKNPDLIEHRTELSNSTVTTTRKISPAELLATLQGDLDKDDDLVELDKEKFDAILQVIKLEDQEKIDKLYSKPFKINDSHKEDDKTANKTAIDSDEIEEWKERLKDDLNCSNIGGIIDAFQTILRQDNPTLTEWFEKNAYSILLEAQSSTTEEYEEDTQNDPEDSAQSVPYNVALENFQSKIINATKNLESQTRKGHAIELNGEVAIVGDIHGDINGINSIVTKLQSWLHEDGSRKVLFLGDIFDRGQYTTETLSKLLEFYLENPDKIFILRGNHETEDATPAEGKSEPLIRDSLEQIRTYWDALPYAAVINETTFAAHAGFPSMFAETDAEKKQACKNFFGSKSLKLSEKEYVTTSLMWTDLDEKITGKTAQIIGSSSRPKYSKECVKCFFEASGYPLRHFVGGHNHDLGPYKQVKLDDEGRTYNLVISSPWLNEHFSNEQTPLGVVLVVRGDKQPEKLFTIDTSGNVVDTSPAE